MLLALSASAALAVGACGSAPATQPIPTGVDLTVGPIRATPWPNGTVGRFGVRVDPGLLSRLPSSVGGLPVVESVDLERSPLDSQDTATTVESFVSAYIGDVNRPDWAAISVLRLRPEAAGATNYPALRDDFMNGACSQAGGVASTTSEQIGDRAVDVGRCVGGPIAYTVRLDSRTLVTALEMGARQLGRQLIAAVR